MGRVTGVWSLPRKAGIALAIAVLSVVASVLGPLTESAAALTCRRSEEIWYLNSSYQTNQWASYNSEQQMVNFWYSRLFTYPRPTSSGNYECLQRIYLSGIDVPGAGDYNPCVDFRVRFFPSSGGSYTTGWRQFCQNVQGNLLAENVAYGTVYRVEALPTPYYEWRNYRPAYTVWD